MAERYLVVDRLKFSYEGLFNAAELYNLIASWFYEKGWDWYEKINDEQVTPRGKQITILLEPSKSTSDYYKLQMRIRLHMVDVKDVEVDHEGKVLRLNHGLVRVTFDGYIFADRKDQWSSSPVYWFLSLIFDNYLFKKYFERMDTWIKSDIDDLHDKIKNYLNVFKYSYHV